uniref:thiopurine S-methyltransferase n=2 Tax=Petromyzon marinus TaxID=7757 RepID=S4R8E2_PETMA
LAGAMSSGGGDNGGTDSRAEEKDCSLPYWQGAWQRRQIGFHDPNVHEKLIKYLDAMRSGRAKLRVFLPLCGKAVDMKWLADLGHEVVGVEGVESAIVEFFSEQNVEFRRQTVPSLPDGELFQSLDGKMSVYRCDFFNFTSAVAGRFDAMWDRGGLVAINASDRERFAAIMTDLMAPGCRYLLDTFNYNDLTFKGPPHYVPESEIRALYGERCDVELLESDKESMADRAERWGLDYIIEVVHLITPK